MDFAALARAKVSVGRVEVQRHSGWIPAGTGFVVGKDLVLTALHVVADRAAPILAPRGPLRIVLGATGSGTRREVGLRLGENRDPDDDWAALATEEAVDVAPLALSARLPVEKEGWWTFGYPRLNDKDGLSAVAELRDPHSVYDRGTAVSLVSDDLKGTEVHGLSGSPLFHGGAVVGLFRSNLEEARRSFGFLYATPMASVLARVDLARALPNPYQGMQPFDEDRAAFFFGRREEAALLIERLRSHRIAVLIGGSGSGKSSLLRAGLQPLVREGALEKGCAMEPVFLRPRNRPLHELALVLAERLTFRGRPDSIEALEMRLVSPRALGDLVDQELHHRHAGDRARGGFLFVVDQLEELYAGDVEPEEARKFIHQLCVAACTQGSRVWWAGALRDGFMTELLRCGRDGDVLRTSLLPLGPVDSKERLREVIVEPAKKAELRFSPPELPDRIAADAADEPGSLPLLQYALDRLWQERDGDALTEEVYLGFGGIGQVVATKAEEAFGKLDESGQELAQRLFLRLVWIRSDGPNTRRLLPYGALQALPSEARALAFRFVTARLLVATAEGLEIAHESLLRQWARLAKWVKEAPEAERRLQQVEAARREWSERGELPEDLMPPHRLRPLADWVLRNLAIVPAEERRFLIESLLLCDLRPEEWGRHFDPAELVVAQDRPGRTPEETLLLLRAGSGDDDRLARFMEREAGSPLGAVAGRFAVERLGARWLVDLADRQPTVREVVSDLLNDPEVQGALAPELPPAWRRRARWGAVLRLAWRERLALLLAAVAVFAAILVVDQMWWVVDALLRLVGFERSRWYLRFGVTNLTIMSAVWVYMERRSVILRRPLRTREAWAFLAAVVAVDSIPNWLANLQFVVLGRQPLVHFLVFSAGSLGDLLAMGLLLPLLARGTVSVPPRQRWPRVAAAAGVSIATAVALQLLPAARGGGREVVVPTDVAASYFRELVVLCLAVAATRWAEGAACDRAVPRVAFRGWSGRARMVAGVVLVLVALLLVARKALPDVLVRPWRSSPRGYETPRRSARSVRRGRSRAAA
ncbi:MAG: trypsin-like peptidase domain-containing protein [Holophagales bacterium]|nr:trypsin-like peptidase domain-containing protein [Holophagales bacterium]